MRISDLLGEPDKRKPDTDDQAAEETSPAAAGATEIPKAPDADRVSFGSALGSSEQRARGVQAGPTPEAPETADAPGGLGAPDDDLLPDRDRKR